MSVLENILSVTLVLVLAYLVLSNPQGFQAFANSSSTAYAADVQALQGR